MFDRLEVSEKIEITNIVRYKRREEKFSNQCVAIV